MSETETDMVQDENPENDMKKSKAVDVFEEDAVPVYQQNTSENITGEQLVLDLDGYDGPIDMLLGLARDQKVDLTQISILALADQYLQFIETAKDLRIELAADYLVMAAWLAYLKSRLLIPQEEVVDDEPTGAEMAEALAFQLRRLEGMRNVAEKLFDRPRLGMDRFARGAPEGAVKIASKSIYEAEIYDILSAYGDIQRRQEFATYTPAEFALMSVEQALERVEAMLGRIPGDWMSLDQFLPGMRNLDRIGRRSAIASTFGASLEMAKRGMIDIQQGDLFSPIYIRKSREAA